MQSEDVPYRLIHPVAHIDGMRHPFTQTVSPTTPITKQSPHLSHCPTVLNSNGIV